MFWVCLGFFVVVVGVFCCFGVFFFLILILFYEP